MFADRLTERLTQALGPKAALDCGSKAEGSSDDAFDDLASTCAPSSVDSSVSGTPDLCPLEGPLDADTILSLLPDSRDSQVCIIHHDEMQLHVPPRAEGIYELPRRVIAIENCLKGLPTNTNLPKRNWGNAPMQFVRGSRGKVKSLVVGFGSVAAKRRRLSCSTSLPCRGSIWEACHIVEAPLVKDADLRLVHSENHVDHVTELCDAASSRNVSYFPLERPFSKEPKSHKGIVDDDVYYAPSSLLAMKRAAGGAVEAVRRLFLIDETTGRSTGRSSIESSFAIVRPPGHHCCGEPNGFCFFNNTAVAAAHAREVLGISRVAIVDWDYHHGDGQQKLFYKDPTVLTISLHVAVERTKRGDEIAFPTNRGMDISCNGLDRGHGYNINIPWPHNKVGAADYFEAFRSVVMPALEGFDPELILVACGFDAVAGDTLAGTDLAPSAYYHMTRQLLSLRRPVAVILEGGYSPSLLARGSLNVVQALLGRDPPQDTDESDASSSDASNSKDDEAEGVLEAVRRQLNSVPPWNTMRRPGGGSYFCEDRSPAGDARLEVARKLSEFINAKAVED